MAFLLCHDCYSWVEPADGRCPECRESVDPSATDPPLSTLKSVIGELSQPVGPVRVRRRLLPERGTLYATTNGLCFVPHKAVYVMRDVEVSGPPSLFWTLATILWSPLMFVMPLVRSKQHRQQRIQTLQPRDLSPEDDQLPLLLMQDPGTFFVPLRSIRHIRRRRRRWIIERRQGASVRFQAEHDDRALRHRMSELLASPTWQGLM